MYSFVKMLSLSGKVRRERERGSSNGKCNILIRRVFRFSILDDFSLPRVVPINK